MNVTCTACGKTVTARPNSLPGDVLTCEHCGADVRLPMLETVSLSPDSRPMTIAEGEVLPAGTLLGQYRIENFVGRGGMGSVYRAVHTMLNRPVAVKVLPPKFAADPEFVGRFRREALALAGLSHPNIVAIHDMGQQGQIYFLVMEFVEGANLRDLLVARRIPPEEALKIVPQLCEALEYAHGQGVIHRDIKPENIMLDRNGQAKIADFGLAKMVKGEKGGPSLTQTNVVMGTVEYMAPEQRDNMKTVDHRADIYSMGVVLYEMLTGELPVGRFDPPSRKVTVDVRVDDVVLKALEREPDRRYQRASQMGTEVSLVRVSRVAPRDIPILDLVSGKAVGTAVGRALVVRGGELAVRIEGWGRDEVGLRIQGPYDLRTDQQPAILEPRKGAESITVFVPKGADLDVSTRDEELRVGGFSGRLAASLHDGEFTGTDLEGRIVIIGNDGDVSISGLKGEDIDIRTNDGSISVSRLSLARGQASFAAHDGDATVNLAPDCSLRYQLFSSGGGVSYPQGGTGDEHAASGQVGAGAASLSIRTHDGAATLAAGGGPTFNADMVRDIWSRMTTKQREKIGVYVIVCGALWLASPVFGTIVPALATTVFWGMALALDIWKQYVRGAGAQQHQGGAQVTAGVVIAGAPHPTAAGNPRPKEMEGTATVPASPTRRVSALAVFAVLSAGLALLPTAGLFVLGMGEWSEMSDMSSGDAEVYWLTLAAFSLAALVTSIVAVSFGMATFIHVRESRGLLFGKTAAFIALAFGVLGMVAASRRGFPALDQAREARLQVRAVTQIVSQSMRDGKSEVLWPLVAQEGLDEPQFRQLHETAHKLLGASAGTLEVEDLSVAPGLEHGQARVWFGSTDTRVIQLRSGNLKFRRSGSEWRIVNARKFFEELGRDAQ